MVCTGGSRTFAEEENSTWFEYTVDRREGLVLSEEW